MTVRSDVDLYTSLITVAVSLSLATGFVQGTTKFVNELLYRVLFPLVACA
jgi:hypothetical protein